MLKLSGQISSQENYFIDYVYNDLSLLKQWEKWPLKNVAAKIHEKTYTLWWNFITIAMIST